MSSWVVVDENNVMKGFATWDAEIDPPWPEKRGRLILLNPNITPPQVGDVIDEWCGVRPHRIRKFIIRWGGWIVAAASLITQVIDKV